MATSHILFCNAIRMNLFMGLNSSRTTTVIVWMSRVSRSSRVFKIMSGHSGVQFGFTIGVVFSISLFLLLIFASMAK